MAEWAQPGRERATHLELAGIGLCAATVVLIPDPVFRLAVGGLCGTSLVYFSCLAQRENWLRWLFFFLLLTPPFPLPLGSSGPHLAPVVALIGAVAALPYARRWNVRLPAPAWLLAAFTVWLVTTGFMAAWYSGGAAATQSILRAGLFGIGTQVLLFAVCSGLDEAANRQLVRFLYWLAVLAALFGCVDHYYQLPSPAGFSPQFVWLDEGVVRRAQGLFYDASTLGNFCAFFLVLVVIAWARQLREGLISRPALLAGGAVFATALALSFSRASVVNVAVALGVFAIRRGARQMKALAAPLLACAAAGVTMTLLMPSLAMNYWSRMSRSIEFLAVSPDSVLSGRLTHWAQVWRFLEEKPWMMIFGAGYKTLAHSDIAGVPVIADNTWLSLLAETGLVGVGLLVAFSFVLLRHCGKVARTGSGVRAMAGEWMVCFWSGELVQMFSGDLITYWRVLPLYFWVLGLAVRETDRSE